MKNGRVIGIAGYSGSGKSTLAKLIADRNRLKLIDVDLLAKEVMQREQSIIVSLSENFGEGVIANNGIDFSILGKKVFNNKDAILKLNSIVHPVLLKILKEEIDKESEFGVVVDAALISYWEIEDWFNSLYWVHLSKDLRLFRIKKRVPNLLEEDIKQRFEIQESLFNEPENGWQILNNNLDIEVLYQRYLDLEEKL